MNEQRSFERMLAERMEAERGGAQLPDAFYDEFRLEARATRQRPRWLAIIKEPPMRISSRLAVGSPTARVMAIMVATLLLAAMVAGAGIAGNRLLAADGATIVVAADGSGDFTTIPEAVLAADDGDTLMVRPGEYSDIVIIDKDITLTGDGPRDDIVIGRNDVPADLSKESCEGDPSACLFVLDQSDGTVSDVTFRGTFSGLGIFGGSPTVESVLFDAGSDRPADGAPFFGAALYIDGGSTARIIGNEFLGESDLTIYGRSSPLIEDNVMRGWSVSADQPGDNTIIRGNEISDSASVAINLQAASKPLIEDNVVTGAGTDGIAIGFSGAGQGWAPTIRGNTITGSGGSAINASPFAAPTIEGNTLVDNRFGVLLQVGDAIVTGNDIQGEGMGIFIAGGGSPSITDNTIDVTGRGISITRGSESTLRGNTVCGEETAIFVDEQSQPSIDDSNEICAG